MEKQTDKLKKVAKKMDAEFDLGYYTAIKYVEKMIDDEIKSIIKLNKNKNVTVNHNFWKAHISQLEELKQQLKNLDKK